ncbi:hypothetical protein FRC01_000298 [Tulasnella sp. 417]|nr:hypothetical protein FRC01_000298 [Tulasnella sp. 417]
MVQDAARHVDDGRKLLIGCSHASKDMIKRVFRLLELAESKLSDLRERKEEASFRDLYLCWRNCPFRGLGLQIKEWDDFKVFLNSVYEIAFQLEKACPVLDASMKYWMELPIISSKEVLRVLSYFPRLERCYLDSLVSLEDFELSEPDQELLRFQDVRNPTIQLSCRNLLSLRRLPRSFVHLFLSVIQAPNLAWLSAGIRIDKDDQSPGSDLLTPRISHLSPTVTTLVGTAKNVEILACSWTIHAGSLFVELDGSSARRNHMDETLEWIFNAIGRHRKALPASLSFFGSNADSEWLGWLASFLKVTKLEFSTDFATDPDVVFLLSNPLAHAWLLPDLEAIQTYVFGEGGKSDILKMAKARHFYVETQGKQEREYFVSRPFKEIRLRGGMNGVSRQHFYHTDFLIEL